MAEKNDKDSKDSKNDRKDARLRDGEEVTPLTDPDPTQYPKTLCHVDSTPGHLVTKTVATPEEEAALGAEWVEVSALGFETAPAAGVIPVVTSLADKFVVGVLAGEIPGGTTVMAIDTVPDRPVTASAARGVLSQPSPAGPPLATPKVMTPIGSGATASPRQKREE